MADDATDLLDQVAGQQPTVTPPAAPPQQSATQTGDLLDQVSSQTNPDSGTLAESAKSWWDKSMLDTITGGTVSEIQKKVQGQLQQVVNHEIASAHPWRAAIAQGYYGTMKDAADFGLSMTTPVNAAINVASIGKGVLLK